MASTSHRRATQQRTCPDCGERYWNAGAHAERCRGPVSRREQQRRTAAALDEKTNWPVASRLICRKIVTSLPLTRCVLDDGHTGPCKGERGS